MKGKHVSRVFYAQTTLRKVICAFMALMLLLLMVPRGLSAHAEDAAKEEAAATEKASEVKDLTDEEATNAEQSKEVEAENLVPVIPITTEDATNDKPNSVVNSNFSVNISTEDSNKFNIQGWDEAGYVGGYDLEKTDSFNDPKIAELEEMGYSVDFSDVPPSAYIDTNNRLNYTWQDEEGYGGLANMLFMATPLNKSLTPIWEYKFGSGSWTLITKDSGSVEMPNDACYFRLSYESPEPENVTVSVDLADGKISPEQESTLKADQWSLSGNVWKHDFEADTKTEKQAMSIWEDIIPAKDSCIFKAWDPVPGDTKLSTSKTFTATYKNIAEIFTVQINAKEGSFSGEGTDQYGLLDDYDITKGTISFADPYLSNPDEYSYYKDDPEGFWVEDNVLKYGYYIYVEEFSDYSYVIWSVNAAEVKDKVPVWTVNGEELFDGDGADFVPDVINSVVLTYGDPKEYHSVTVDLTDEGRLAQEPDSSWEKHTDKSSIYYTKDFPEGKPTYDIIWNDFNRHPSSKSEYHHAFETWHVSPNIEKLTEDATFTPSFVCNMKAYVNMSTNGPKSGPQGTFSYTLDVNDVTMDSVSYTTKYSDKFIHSYSWNENSFFNIDEDGVITYYYWFTDNIGQDCTAEGTIYPDKTIDYKFKGWSLNGKTLQLDTDYALFRDYIIKVDDKIPQYPEFNFVAEFEESSTFTIEGSVSKESGGHLANVNVSFMVDGQAVATDVTDNFGWYVLDIDKKYCSGGIVYVDPGEPAAYYPCSPAFKSYSDITSDFHYEHFRLAQSKPIQIEVNEQTSIGHAGFMRIQFYDGNFVSREEVRDDPRLAIVPGAKYAVNPEHGCLIFTWTTEDSVNNTQHYNMCEIRPFAEEGYEYDNWTLNGNIIQSGEVTGYDPDYTFAVNYKVSPGPGPEPEPIPTPDEPEIINANIAQTFDGLSTSVVVLCVVVLSGIVCFSLRKREII